MTDKENTNSNTSGSSEESSLLLCENNRYSNKCLEHKNSDLLYFAKYGKLIKRGRCLDHHKNKYVAFSVRDFVLGNDIFSITRSIGWHVEGIKVVVKGILNALLFLQNNGLSHGNLDDTTVLIDKFGQIKCADFFLVSQFVNLITEPKQRNEDVACLGKLIEKLLPVLPFDLRNFVDKCKHDFPLASNLLDHPFLRRLSLHQPITQSRLTTEFEILQYHKKGAFGDVLKVRNILDKREYAIKRIRLLTTNEQLYEKIIREVELLSRLNHVNVVRYFNSWIEEMSEELEELEKSGYNLSHSTKSSSTNDLTNIGKIQSKIQGSFALSCDDSNSDGIEFVDSEGKVIAEYHTKISDDEDQKHKILKPLNQVMYIQMEFCEKSTLRQSIDDDLYKNTVRSWQLFREILEGLSYIHQQGIIHRDLKPDNIFLDSRDQIKIGDFGLATTNFSLLHSNDQNEYNIDCKNNYNNLGTGTVGTILYIAPELTSCDSKPIYNEKVDMYTLGIILFEMSNPPFKTVMERVKTITALRSKNITLPEKMLKDAWYEQNEIIRWLLKHDSCLRPTAKELLNSNLMLQGNFKAYVASEANFV
ncbi:eIF-2-alpha kinase GCN2-like [Condylostylus longicornis]|uniref:eIF-2-alpha kinase GCN2-like n=1 Tax=Condylostylus longicornis TaxID=2530218 RepID=UPI00244E5AF5|nr:eIF-2-alpha kinase GCN2-like [Condylostylus longicornis]